MDVRIASDLIDAIVAAAAATPDREVCGLLLGDVPERVGDVRSTANVAADPTSAFEIDPTVLFAAIRAERTGGPGIIGHFHSHPNGSPTPSARDAAMADRPGRLWLIVAGGVVGAWRERPGGSMQGAFEPVRLVVDRATSGCA
jgi:proteasome lid subunit RPN8/RPN11